MFSSQETEPVIYTGCYINVHRSTKFKYHLCIVAQYWNCILTVCCL